MAKEIMFGGWVSIVPDKMLKSWIKRKFIPNDRVLCFGEDGNKLNHGNIIHRFLLLNDEGYIEDHKWCKTKQEIKEFLKLGYKKDNCKVILLYSEIYNIMHKEVRGWYQQVFDYIEEWLLINNLLHIEKGNLQTGFCVESDPNHEVVKDWGAPLAKENNKVVQMKEKFGEFVVYFTGLTDKEDKLVKKFAKEVEKKFDCKTRFC